MMPDQSAANHMGDQPAAATVFRRCQELGVRLVVLTRTAAYGASVPAFIYDELATVGHPVAIRLRQSQIASLTAMWRKACLPPGHAGRGGLPARCDRQWFEKIFCGGADLSSVAMAGEEAGEGGGISEGGGIWPHVTALNMYDPLAMLAAHPQTLERFFEVELKTVQGVEHMVIGTSEERPGIRNGNALRSFLMDAFRYALSETLEHAWARAHPERSPTPPGRSPGASRRSSTGEGSSPPGARRSSTFSFKERIPRSPSMSMSFSSSKSITSVRPSVLFNELPPKPRSRRVSKDVVPTSSTEEPPYQQHTPEDPSGRESTSAGSPNTKRWRASDRLRSET